MKLCDLVDIIDNNMDCVVCYDSEKEPECYHRDEEGNHIVALW